MDTASRFGFRHTLYPVNAVTDHRINLTLYKLDKIMNGDIQEILDALIAADQTAKLAKMNEG